MRSAPPDLPVHRPSMTDLTNEDRAVLARVEDSLADGVTLLRWWRRTDAADAYDRRFQLIRKFNTSDESFAFFGRAPILGRTLPVMGTVEDMLYDQPKTSVPGAVRDQLREFVLHYFMRVSAFERPEAYAETGSTATPRFFSSLSWCPTPEASRAGFGFTQHYYKLRDSGVVGKFPEDRRFHIVDLREIGSKYDWIVAKVRIYDFNLTVRPRGQDSLQVVVPLREESYLVVSPHFLANQDDPAPDVLGRYGFGYAFIRNPTRTGALAYGPGEFTASFQLIHFHVLANGRIRLNLVFVVNRPEVVVSITLNPITWGLRLADLTSFGLASRLLAPLRAVAGRLPLPPGGVDVVRGFITLANVLSGGAAARDYCISMEQLERQFLVQHFMQHYQMVVGSLLTWRQHPDWLDRAALPTALIEGVST